MADERILIIGAGTFGLSTAYHLARAGYHNITVLEKDDIIPSRASAGNDLNKIIRAEYEDPWYAHLALEAIHEWTNNPLFAPYYHQVGYLLATSPSAPEKAKRTLAKSLSSISQHPSFVDRITPINSRQDISAVAPAFDGPMQWTGYFDRLAGYAHATDALQTIFVACCELGVSFEIGDGAAELLWKGTKYMGAVTYAGERYQADTVIVTLGASVAALVPTIEPQVTAKAWSIAHIQLLPSEVKRLRGIPVTYARDLGFLFEPDLGTGLLKICPFGAGITNFDFNRGTLSLPPKNSSFIPARDEEAARRLLRETLPELADRPLIQKKMCWVADARDSDYIIDYVLERQGLIAVSGDSGHGFKMLPIVGLWVKKLIEGRQSQKRWQWKAETSEEEDVSWRVGQVTDLADIFDISAN